MASLVKLRKRQRRSIHSQRTKRQSKRCRTSLRRYKLPHSTPSQVGSALCRLGLNPQPSKGRSHGQMVYSQTIVDLLMQLPGLSLNRMVRFYIASVDTITNKAVCCIPPDSTDHEGDTIVLLHHVSSSNYSVACFHFSVIILDCREHVAHLFDTLNRWSSGVRLVVVENLLGGAIKGWQVHDHTGRFMQSGAQCGPHSLWVACAFALDYKHVRGLVAKAQYGPLCEDPIEFWKEVTY